MNLEKIKDFIRFISKSGVTDVSLETEDFKISISSPSRKKRNQDPVIIKEEHVKIKEIEPASATIINKKEEIKVESEDKYIYFKSPMIGTFYRRSSPDKDPFVEVGSEIKEGDVLCVVEAMKLFNEIESNVSGKIVKILIDDQQPIEYDQSLFLIDPLK